MSMRLRTTLAACVLVPLVGAGMLAAGAADEAGAPARFQPIGMGALSGQLTSVGISASINNPQWGKMGGTTHRNLNIAGMIGSLGSSRVFRIAGEPRLVSIRDGAGRDLLRTAGHRSSHPTPQSQGHRWTWPTGPGSWLTTGFGFNLGELDRLPRTIDELVLEVEVDVVEALGEHMVDPVPTDEAVELADGVRFHLRVFDADSSRCRIAFDYDVSSADAAARREIVRVEAIDTDGRVITSIDQFHTIATRDRLRGSVPDWHVSVRSREIVGLRVWIVTDVARHVFRFEERDLRLLGRR